MPIKSQPGQVGDPQRRALEDANRDSDLHSDSTSNGGSALRPAGKALRQEEEPCPQIGIVEGAQQGPVLFSEAFSLGSQASLEFREFLENGGCELDPSLGEGRQGLGNVA